MRTGAKLSVPGGAVGRRAQGWRRDSVRMTDQGDSGTETVAMGEVASGPAGTDHGGPSGRNYVVVSADTHASPDSLDHFLSYVDPAHREAVAAFGDMSSLAISMFGGFDPGEVDESDPVRATAARRLAGMGVDTDAAEGWLAHYGTDWVVPGDGDGRRLQVLEEQGIHAEVTLPGPILAGGLSPAMYLGATTDKGLEVVWPALHGYVRWLAEFCAAAPGRRAGCMPIDFHDMDRAVRGGGVGAGQRDLRRRHAPRHVGHLQAPRVRRRVLRAVLERLRGAPDGGQPPHRGLGLGHRHEVPLRPGARRHARPLRGVRLHAPPAVVHDLRRRVRPPSRPQGRGHGERRAMAAVTHPGHGVVLRHPRRRARSGPTSRCGRATTSRSTSGWVARS